MNTASPALPAAPVAPQAPPVLRRMSDLPGPRGWPLVGNTLQVHLPQLHLDMERWLTQHGPMLRVNLARNELLVISDHELIGALLRDRPDGFRRPSQLLEILIEMGIKPGVFSAEGASWANQRRMVMASFSPGHVRAYFPALVRVTERLQRRWLKAADERRAVDLQAELMRFTVDAISGLAFGKDINTLESDEEIIQQHLDKIFPAIWRRTNAVLPYWRWFKLPVDRELTRSIHVVNEAIQGFVQEARQRLQDPARRAQPQNLLEGMIVAADEPDSGVNDDDVAGNVFTLLLAGEDTTATSLSWMIYLLSRHPEALRRARDEVDRVLPPGQPWTPEHMAQLDFIEACTNEAMRLKPVGPFNVVEALKDTVVGDVAVPKGTMVFMILRHDNLSERCFKQATSFKPERWLDKDAKDAPAGASNAKRVSMPFGAGPRVCPGRYLALLEIKLAMAMLLQSFDIDAVETPDGREAQELMSFTMVPVGLKLRVKRRQAA